MSSREASLDAALEDERDTLVDNLNASSGSGAANRRDRCWVTVLSGGTPGTIFRMEDAELVFGRGSDAAARLPLEAMSRRHARLFRKGDAVWIEDLESANGTFVNGERVLGPRPLLDGDRIEFGRSAILRFSLQDALEEQATIRVYNSSVRDPLVGVYNRAYFEDRLSGEFSFAKRSGTPLSVLMIDADHFKRINDDYGHPTGDSVLRVLGTALTRITRKEDVIARYGGEEFVILARAVSLRNATIFGERLRRHVEALRLPLAEQTLRVTVSIGVAAQSDDCEFASGAALVAAADAALYAAKRAGRNCVVGG